jgi:hypothetical protein
MKTNEKGEPHEDPGETAASMMGSMNRVIRHLRDQRREYLETTKGLHGGPIFKENFQYIWSSVRYDRHVAARQDRDSTGSSTTTRQITSSTRRSSLDKPCPSGTHGHRREPL